MKCLSEQSSSQFLSSDQKVSRKVANIGLKEKKIFAYLLNNE